MLEDTECDTELCLTPGGRHYCPSSHSNTAESSRMKGQEGNTSQQQHITIFYGGRVCVCDATEIQGGLQVETSEYHMIRPGSRLGTILSYREMQARAIICMAQREMEEMAANKQNDQGMEPYPPSPASRTPPAMPQLLNPGLSMKRSLKQFLQKRKRRTDG